MDIKPELLPQVEELAKKLKSDDKLAAGFQADPVHAMEQLLGRDLPDDKLRALSSGLLARLAPAQAQAKIKTGVLRPPAEAPADAAAPDAPPVKAPASGRLADSARRQAMKKHK